MDQTASLPNHPKMPENNGKPDVLEDDPRMRLARRIVAGRHFVKSPLLSRFLLYVVTETLEGREEEISEHQIGVQVFGRAPGYLTAEDNIVRNYARQLRKRLAEHFAGEGSSEALRVEIPHGGYVPVFVQVDEGKVERKPVAEPVAAVRGVEVSGGWRWQRVAGRALLLAGCSAMLVGLLWYARGRTEKQRANAEPAHLLWAGMFEGPRNSYIVPADAGFNLLEDLSHRPLPLAEYIDGGYLGLPLTQVDTHSAEDLKSQQFTSFVDLQIVTALARRPEFNPERVILRFPRDLRVDDLKNANAVIIGSVGSNPWAAVAEESSNFRIVYRGDMQGAEIVNVKPEAGEAATYVSHWNESAHETFAVISYLPNLGGSGHILLLQGLDVAGTQAAAELLLRQHGLDGVLRQAIATDGGLRFFEVLLRSTSIQSSAAGTQVIAYRIH